MVDTSDSREDTGFLFALTALAPLHAKQEVPLHLPSLDVESSLMQELSTAPSAFQLLKLAPSDLHTPSFLLPPFLVGPEL
jgi:hypothetical protein